MEKCNKILIDIGVKDTLLAKLDSKVITLLAGYAERSPLPQGEILKMVVSLASLELQGKTGAALLGTEGVATLQQLKNIELKDLAEIAIEYELYQDAHLSAKSIKRSLIMHQQSVMFAKTMGSVGDMSEHYGMLNK